MFKVDKLLAIMVALAGAEREEETASGGGGGLSGGITVQVGGFNNSLRG